MSVKIDKVRASEYKILASELSEVKKFDKEGKNFYFNKKKNGNDIGYAKITSKDMLKTLYNTIISEIKNKELSK